jgi:ABC-type transport system involved in cytochrome bd biosynthesis fused ATPase/permease subunit
MTYHPTPPACANDCADDIVIGFELLKRIQRGRVDACARHIRSAAVYSVLAVLLVCLIAAIAGGVALGREQPLRAILCALAALNVLAAMLVMRRTARALRAAFADLHEARALLDQTEEDSAAFAASGHRERP